MKKANIAELKNHLGTYLAAVERGERVRICKRNVPIAEIVPLPVRGTQNRTQLGSGLGSVEVHGDLTEPLIPEAHWEMLVE